MSTRVSSIGSGRRAPTRRSFAYSTRWEIQDRQGVREFSDKDTLLDFFFSVWQEVKAEWGTLWVPELKLISKVGLAAMTRYVADSAAKSFQLGEFEITDPKAVRARVKALLAFQIPDFWTADWLSTGKDNPAGQQAVADALVQINLKVRRGRAWKADIKLLNASDGGGFDGSERSP